MYADISCKNEVNFLNFFQEIEDIGEENREIDEIAEDIQNTSALSRVFEDVQDYLQNPVVYLFDKTKILAFIILLTYKNLRR